MEMISGCDMIVNLTALPPEPVLPDGVRIKRAMAEDMEPILAFVRENFSSGWAGEVACALHQCPSRCFIATTEGRVGGFACYDATAKGFFGPMGVQESLRGQRIGSALLLRTLHTMRSDGYGYGIIGWVSGAESFYRKLVGAEFIPGGDPAHSVYRDMIFMP